MVEDRSSVLINGIGFHNNEQKGGRNDGIYVVGSNQQIQGKRVPVHPSLFPKYSLRILFENTSALPQNDIES